MLMVKDLIKDLEKGNRVKEHLVKKEPVKQPINPFESSATVFGVGLGTQAPISQEIAMRQAQKFQLQQQTTQGTGFLQQGIVSALGALGGSA